jgi:hypothetical protein
MWYRLAIQRFVKSGAVRDIISSCANAYPPLLSTFVVGFEWNWTQDTCIYCNAVDHLWVTWKSSPSCAIGRGLRLLYKFCNFGYSSLDDNGAAVVLGTDELFSATIRNLLCPVALMVKWVAVVLEPTLCASENQRSSSTQLLWHLSLFELLRLDELYFNYKMHCELQW